jgi:ribosomal protein S18 acetylase RimI-like enzyme
MAYGYTGRPGQWWHTEVARGLDQADHERRMLTDYFELTELHVRPEYQGRGDGEALLRSLMLPVRAPRVLLSTPEGESRAWRLYRRLGFFDVLRHFLFTGDARPFAVLGRSLPL